MTKVDASSVLRSFSESGRPALIVDFDGTISDIVSEPADARPVSNAIETLSALAASGCRTIVLSGRPAKFLRAALRGLASDVHLVGHSGLETAVGGEIVVDPSVIDWIPVVRQARINTEPLLPDGVVLEDKDLSFALHFRAKPEAAPAATELAAHIAADSGLSMKPGRMVVELRPPVAVDKGTAVRKCLDGPFDWGLFAGDDLVDLPAFDALRRVCLHSVCVAVGSAEGPSGLLEAADLEVASPTALVELLATLRRS